MQSEKGQPGNGRPGSGKAAVMQAAKSQARDQARDQARGQAGQGQAALEYLMTYGWALVAMAVVVTVLIFMGLLKPPTASTCTGLDKFAYEDHTIDANGNFALYLLNGTGQDISNISASFAGDFSGTASPSTENVAAGNDFRITGSTGILAGSAYSGRITITYLRGRYGRHTETASCAGTAALTSAMQTALFTDSNWESGDYNSMLDLDTNTPGELSLATVASYAASGYLISKSFGSAQATQWQSIIWAADLPPGTSISLQTRSSDDSADWSAWSSPYTIQNGEAIASPDSRYIQYKATLTTTNQSLSPKLYDVRITGNILAQPPTSENEWMQTSTADFSAGSLSNTEVSSDSVSLASSGLLSSPLPGGDFNAQNDFTSNWQPACSYVYDGYAPNYNCEYSASEGGTSGIGSLYLYTDCCTPLNQCSGSGVYIDKQVTGNLAFELKADANPTGFAYVQANSSIIYRQQNLQYPSFTPVDLNLALDYQGQPTGITTGSTARLYFFAYACSGGTSALWIDGIKMKQEGYYSSGTFTSGVFDAASPRDFTRLSFLADIPAGTAALFQLRAANTEAELSTAQWQGPTGMADYYTTSNTGTNPVHDSMRWLQYKAYLTTNDSSKTPIINSVTISYT